MKIVQEKISIAELREMSKKMFGGLVKAVVDVQKEIMVVDADMHADEEILLLENDSQQENLWGINIFPDRIGADNWVEFDSMINLRPSWGNNSRGVDDPKLQNRIREIVKRLVV